MGKALVTICAAAMISVAGPGLSQQISEQRIVSSLGKLVGAAPIVDVELLRQEAAAGKDTEMAELPNWSKVVRLPQIAVEIRFQNDSIGIEPESYQTLGMIADAMHHPNLWRYHFLIVGHSSSTGSDRHNLDLSDKRAAAIREALSTTFGIEPSHVHSVGVGKYFPIEGLKGSSAENRRVQLFNLGIFTKAP